MYGDKCGMGYIYEGMDKAKEAIKTFYEGDSSQYLPIWKIIDSKCDKYIKSLLHAMGAYLNPSIFYNEGSKIQKDLKV